MINFIHRWNIEIKIGFIFPLHVPIDIDNVQFYINISSKGTKDKQLELREYT